MAVQKGLSPGDYLATPAERHVSDGPAEVNRAPKRAAHWLDDAFRIPGTSFRIGWDGLLGLIPGIGSLVTLVPALWIVLRGIRMGVPAAVAARMVGNVGIDSIGSSVPVLGNVFDFFWKANRRNIRLLEAYERRPDLTRRRSKAALLVAAAGLIMVGLGLLVGSFLLLVWLIEQFGIGSV